MLPASDHVHCKHHVMASSVCWEKENVGFDSMHMLAWVQPCGLLRIDEKHPHCPVQKCDHLMRISYAETHSAFEKTG